MRLPGIARPEPISCFFFSYASEDTAKDGLLHGFAKDLQEAVATRFRLETDPPGLDRAGFVDRTGIRSAQVWAERLGQALRTSCVLICMVSEAYLRSEACGKELSVFLRRRKMLPDKQAQVIIPIIWDARHLTNALPTILKDFNLTDPTFPTAYHNKGLRSLALAASVDYRSFLAALTDIIAIGVDAELAELPLDQDSEWERLENALLPAAPATSNGGHSVHRGTQLIAEMQNSRPFEVKFLYVVPTRRELPPERTFVDQYPSADGWYWQPYGPAVPDSVGQIVNKATLKFRKEDLSFPRDNLVEYLSEADADDKAVILLLDPWAALIPTCRRVLQAIDTAGIRNYAVLIVRNGQDTETMAAAEKLNDALRIAFPISFNRAHPDYFRKGLLSPDDLDKAVDDVLRHMSETIVDYRAARMRIGGASLPTLKPGTAA